MYTFLHMKGLQPGENTLHEAFDWSASKTLVTNKAGLTLRNTAVFLLNLVCKVLDRHYLKQWVSNAMLKKNQTLNVAKIQWFKLELLHFYKVAPLQLEPVCWRVIKWVDSLRDACKQIAVLTLGSRYQLLDIFRYNPYTF